MNLPGSNTPSRHLLEAFNVRPSIDPVRRGEIVPFDLI
jgi:hypothetical protein